MDQLTLFAAEGRSSEAGGKDTVAIRSDRVGPVRFGATEASFALTRTVLAALAVPPADTDADPGESS
jgi:hypothetical protein